MSPRKPGKAWRLEQSQEGERWGTSTERQRGLLSQVSRKKKKKKVAEISAPSREEQAGELCSVTKDSCKHTYKTPDNFEFIFLFQKEKYIFGLFFPLFLDVALAVFLHNKPPNRMNA